MDKLELMRLVVTLYASMPMVSDYRIPDAHPEIHIMPKTVLQDLVCSAPCHIRAIYHPDFGLLIDETLDVAGNVYDRSIVFHELVHHSQHVNAKFAELHTVCERRAASEQEAYGLQNRYLSMNGASEPVTTLNWNRLCARQQREERSTLSMD